MQLDEETISRVLKCQNPKKRVQETASLFRLLSEEIIKDLRADNLTNKAFILFGSMTYSVGGDTARIFEGNGVFADVAKGEEPNEYFAQLWFRRGDKRSKELEGGFSLFYEQDYTKLNNQLNGIKEAK